MMLAKEKLPPFVLPQCEEPLIIVNSVALTLLQKGGKLSTKRRLVGLCSNVNDDRVRTRLLRYAHRVAPRVQDYQLLAGYYVTLDDRVEYLYRVVGCGKCDACVYTRKVDFCNRCRLESECYSCPPYFFTLTYNQQNLPGNGQLHYKHVQDFFKRLRRACERRGLPTDFRYAVAGEYGSKRGRPHYHVIMWNNPLRASDFLPMKSEQLCRLLWNCWRKDDWQVFSQPKNFGVCRDGAAGYTAKYIGKGKMPKGCWIKPFVHQSTGNGGLGRPFLEKFRGHYTVSSDSQLRYVSQKTGQVCELNFGSFIRQYYHPSPTRLVPQKVLYLYRDMVKRVQRYVDEKMLRYDVAYEFVERHRPYKSVLRNTLRSPQYSDVRHCHLYAFWLFNKEQRQCDELLEYVDDDLPASDVSMYYRYQREQIEHDVCDVVDKAMKARKLVAKHEYVSVM